MIELFKKYIELRIKISEADFNEIGKLLVLKNVHKGEHLVLAGENSQSVYFVLSGCLRSYCVVDKKEYVMQFASENWWIGDKFMFSKTEQSLVNIDAIEDSSVLQFNADLFDQMEKIVPETKIMMQELKQNRYQSLQKRILSLISIDAEQRYVHFVKMYPGLSKRVPLQMIASYLGITPQSLSRVRSKKFLASY